MKALKFSTQLPLIALTLLFSLASISSSIAAQPEVTHNAHESLVRHYENLAKEAKAKLEENKTALEKYEAHSHYYGRQGQELKSHASANIRGYEKDLEESLRNADLHRKMAAGQGNPINKAKINLDRDTTTIR
jgi:hypothetical protein